MKSVQKKSETPIEAAQSVFNPSVKTDEGHGQTASALGNLVLNTARQ